MLKKVISLWSWLIPWGTLWWISIGIVICKWEFWFFDLLMAIFSLLECFSTFHNYLYKSGPLQFGGLVWFKFAWPMLKPKHQWAMFKSWLYLKWNLWSPSSSRPIVYRVWWVLISSCFQDQPLGTILAETGGLPYVGHFSY